MARLHIGKKIKEVVDKSSFTVVDFAKKINLTRDGAYKLFTKETIDTDQLKKISNVLGHDFFLHYQDKPSMANEKKSSYGYAPKEDVEVLTKMVHTLIGEIEKLRADVNGLKKSSVKKKK